jgi:hypothetical protein
MIVRLMAIIVYGRKIYYYAKLMPLFRVLYLQLKQVANLLIMHQEHYATGIHNRIVAFYK